MTGWHVVINLHVPICPVRVTVHESPTMEIPKAHLNYVFAVIFYGVAFEYVKVPKTVINVVFVDFLIELYGNNTY